MKTFPGGLLGIALLPNNLVVQVTADPVPAFRLIGKRKRDQGISALVILRSVGKNADLNWIAAAQ